MLTCFVTALILYGVPLYYSLMAVKMGGAAPEENKKWSVYWLVTFITIPLFYIVSFFGCTITTILRVGIAIWLYHPHFEGALLINQTVKPYLEKFSADVEKIFKMFPLTLLKLNEDHTKVE